MSSPYAHPDEIVASLKKSNLPTVIVEGRLDSYVYRYLERRTGASVLPVGGRNSLLQVLRQRDAFASLPCAFVADRDMWLFSALPPEAQSGDLVLTDGYSIENDIYRDSGLENLLTAQQRVAFQRDCREVCRWFSFAAAKWVNGEAPQLDHHPKRMVSRAGILHPQFVAATGFDGECPQRFPTIVADHSKYLRGKTLVDLLLKVIEENGGPRHRASSVMEVGALQPGPLLTALSDEVAAILGQ